MNMPTNALSSPLDLFCSPEEFFSLPKRMENCSGFTVYSRNYISVQI